MSEIIRYKPSEMADAILGLDTSSIRLQSIDILSEPIKKKYAVGETFDPSGINIEANFNHNFKKNATNLMSYNPTNLNSSSINNVTATYTDKGISKYKNIYINVYNYSDITWANGTDEEIEFMVSRANKGEIDLTDYWHIGDERVVHLNTMPATDVLESHAEQDIIMVLMDTNNVNYTYVETPTSGRTNPFFIVCQKQPLKKSGIMSSDDTTYSWSSSSCVRRIWCDDVYKNSLPTIFSKIFKEVSYYSYYKDGSRYYSNNTSSYFFLPNINEMTTIQTVFNDYTAIGDVTWEYFKNEQNVLIKPGDTGNATSGYWSRSGYYWGDYKQFYYIYSYTSGNSVRGDSAKGNYSKGLVVAGCI